MRSPTLLGPKGEEGAAAPRAAPAFQTVASVTSAEASHTSADLESRASARGEEGASLKVGGKNLTSGGNEKKATALKLAYNTAKNKPSLSKGRLGGLSIGLLVVGPVDVYLPRSTAKEKKVFINLLFFFSRLLLVRQTV